ncbi:similar to Saccharomyces cerevisiae YLL038C ENT4 Protein of unknown function, contains an N- terminal epsin-like domain [Maudiozyma barnettii]|uniref:ENTH domain-containing protein n=1 Tax=Maudiozyma barnettii TaxID=61262 RepID=A0A8H2VD35_9SACH|nr:Ent4p [Kazachstania barnettii]CAB4252998.1 similar to Saccharomyces cerevisiae YLL038C ENT4 Protein of unknown function, contains an N- terminal epsin-like domain [Kazachstania barnettii]CAD1780150.1 similar to Saccharomyces cerevisiae YLL038C ENT4 Protein of unknown function, contains an N- terminal epsin-like domain [Kazachstania barnettii]
MSMFLSSVKNFVQSPTELKVKQATDEDENFGATATLMNEISVLTYSSKTLKEIIPIIKKKLLLGYNKRIINHKNSIMLLKTLTLVSYLMNNGSNDFVRWIKSNIDVFVHLNKLSLNVTDKKNDAGIVTQIVATSKDITLLINDDDLLEKRRRDVVQFRSSISSPGRKSTDNSHLKSIELTRIGSENKYSNNDPNKVNNSSSINLGSPRILQSSPLQRNSHSLDLRISSNPLRNTGEYSRTSLGPVREEDTGDSSALRDLRGLTFSNEHDGGIDMDEFNRSRQEAVTTSGTSFRSRFKNNIPFV